MALAADVAKLVVSLRLDDSGFSGKLNAAAASLNRMDTGLSQMGRGAGQVAGGLGRLATVASVAAAGGLAAVVTTAASFEQAFTGVEKTVDGTEAQLGELEETIRQMARTMPLSFEELAGIGEAGGALGIARDSLDEFIDVVARLSVSTNLTSDQAATALGQLGNVLHLTGSDFEDFADSLVALGNAGASTEDQIVDIAARFGAAGNAAGLSKEEILALSSAVASMGIEAEAGGSSLSRVFTNVATSIGTGGDEIQAFTDIMGISADEFQKRWGEDALGTFQDFLGELNKLDQFGQARVLEEAGITGVRDQQAVRLMAQNVGFLADQLEVAEQATGALDKESNKFFETTQGQWKILQNNVRDAGATIGAELLPIVNEAMGDLVGWLQEAETQQGLKNFAKDLAEGVRGLVTEIRNADFGPLLDTMKGAAGIAKAAFDAFRSLPEPIQQLALAAIVANKVSGGAVGQIAKGLGNILGGSIKIFAARGTSPANPLWVQSVGGLPGTGGVPVVGGVGKGGGFGGLVGNALKFLPALLAAEVASEVSPVLGEIASDIHEEFLDFLPDIDLSDVEWPFGSKNTPTILPEIFGGNGLLGGVAADLKEITDTAKSTSRVFGGSWEGGKLGSGPLQQTDKLKSDEVITLLRKTSEIGDIDIGTEIEDGVARGTDPLGDTMVRILARADDPKAPAVMDQIQGHIAALEEVQKQYAASGDDDTVQHLQSNIDKLSELIGVTDQTKVVMSELKGINQGIAGSFGAIDGKLGGILAKNPVTNVNVTTPVYVQVGVSEIQYRINSLRTTVGGGGFI